MKVIKFFLDLSDINRKNWNDDIESTALWLHDFLNHSRRAKKLKRIDKAKDFAFAYTINKDYKRAVVFIKSQSPRKNLHIFTWYWVGKLKHQEPSAIEHWGRIPFDVGKFVDLEGSGDDE